MNIYLVRHTSVDVPKGHTYGQTDVPLRQTFEDEAAEVKHHLDQITFDKIWTSPLSRCTRLATFCGYPDATHEDRIKELNFGEWEMKSWNELSADPRSEQWFNNWTHIKTPNGEAFIDQYKRVSNFLDELRATNHNNICLFTHGGVITCARIYNGDYPMQDAFTNIPPYGSILQLTY